MSSKNLNFLLHDVARLSANHFNKLLEPHGMSLAQSRLLIALYRYPGLRQVDIAELMEVQPITVGRLIDQLAKNGMVERRPDEHDRRVFRIYLLEGSEPMLQHIEQALQAVRDIAFKGLPAEIIDQMREGLAGMKGNLMLVSKTSLPFQQLQSYSPTK